MEKEKYLIINYLLIDMGEVTNYDDYVQICQNHCFKC